MCGFSGFTNTTAVSNREDVLHTMLKRIVHRGPDSAGEYIDDHIALGFRRLSLQDLETGNQPMYNEDKSIILTFNGEIYNFQALREELLAAGHVFASKSDAEVLVHLYEEHGTAMLDKLRGMYAFVIYNKNEGTIFVARDPFGIKPFYYTWVGDTFLFGSEIKAFLDFPGFEKRVNLDALEHYLSFQYSVLPETFFAGVYKLPPGHFFTCKVDDTNNLKLTRFFEAKFDPQETELAPLTDQINAVMQDSIRHHEISDEEIGSFLSSGVDSSYVAANSAVEKTFTVGYDHADYSEIEFAQASAKRIERQHYAKRITADEFWASLETIQYHMDEPLADPAAIPLYFLTKFASTHVKACLSGEGADELFGGYEIYREPLGLAAITRLPMGLRRFLGKFAGAIPFSFKGKNYFIRGSKPVEERFIGNANIFAKKEREAILKQPRHVLSPAQLTKSVYDTVQNVDDITKMQIIDINFWMPGDILLKVDKMSMANSLEVRTPFLDPEVWALASTIPTHLRANKTTTKYAFREAARKSLSSESAEKKKLGFPVPIRVWLREDAYYTMVKDAFCSDTAAEFFHTDKLIALLDAHRGGRVDNSRKIWTVYMFLLWHRAFFARE